MSVVAALVSYGCIQIFVAACVLRWAHSGDVWLVRQAIPQSAGFRDAPTGDRERWWIPRETLWSTTLIVMLGAGGLWPVAWTVEVFRYAPLGGWTPTGAEVAVAWLLAGLWLIPTVAALGLVLRRPHAAAHTQTTGLAALVVALPVTLLTADGWDLRWRWPRDLAWCAWVPVLLGLTATALAVLLIRAGAKAEAAELLHAADPET